MAKLSAEIKQIVDRIFAERSASNPDYKYKSAMRYAQRIRAGEGKQRIKTPRGSGLSEETKAKLAELKEISIESDLPDFWEKVVDQYEQALADGIKNFKIEVEAKYLTNYSNDSRSDKLRKVNFYLTAEQAAAFFSAASEQAAFKVLSETADGNFFAGKNKGASDLSSVRLR